VCYCYREFAFLSSMERGAETIPIIDISTLLNVSPSSSAALADCVSQIRDACCTAGFFYIINHGIPASVEDELEASAAAFFARPQSEKRAIRMALGGSAWRGYFAVGEELTSGLPDQKEGLYIGTELPPTHSLVALGTPLHGANLYPADAAGEKLRRVVDAYTSAATQVGQAVLRGISLSLGLPAEYIFERSVNPQICFVHLTRLKLFPHNT
jgi:isopenicillin N synthase-like dioxygenase